MTTPNLSLIPPKPSAVYVAGPMRGIADFNFPAFDEASTILRVLGFTVFNPADRDRDIHGPDVNKSATGNLADVEHTGFSLRDALGADTAWIAQHADAIAVLPGWENSRGAKAEVALAHALGLVVAPIEEFTFLTLPTSSIHPDETPEAKVRWSEFGTSVSDVPAWSIPKAVDDPARFEATDGEVRTVSSTGGAKGVKLERFDLIPAEAMRLLARLYGEGAKKYAARNWEAGYEWSKSYGALQRHLWLFWSGEDIDEETGVPHVINAAWHCLAIAQFMSDPEQYATFDDRA